MLPGPLRSQVEARLGPVLGERPVGGGCIDPSLRLELPGGPVFLKYSAHPPDGYFAVEAEGLRALRAAAGELRVPEVLHAADDWLALEWIEPGRPGPGYTRRLGRGLAAMHRAAASGWGWERDGFIGSLPQANAPAATWADFWWSRRLEPQLERARGAGLLPAREAEWERLRALLPGLLAPAEEDGPSLVHGDLWSGNLLAAATGEPTLVDPAAYRGHREVDLAMAELFGGFPAGFVEAYHESWPLRPGYEEVRRGIYQLYFLLAHVNLFGEGYLSRTSAALRGVLSAA